jgi:hypothetical protein
MSQQIKALNKEEFIEVVEEYGMEIYDDSVALKKI